MDTLTTLDADAVRFTAQSKTNAEKAVARKNISAAEDAEVEALRKQVTMLQAQAEGKTFVYETDSAEAYAKTVPDGAYPYAAVRSFGGKTIAWNQVATPALKSISYTLTEDAPSNKWGPVVTYLSAAQIGHVFLGVTGVSPTGGCATAWSNSGYKPFDGIYTLTQSMRGNGAVRWWIPKSAKAGTYTASLQLFDLTAIFGAGKEPSTLEDFQKRFPATYYDYCAGELKSAATMAVRCVAAENLLPDIYGEGTSTLKATISGNVAHLTGVLPESTNSWIYIPASTFVLASDMYLHAKAAGKGVASFSLFGTIQDGVRVNLGGISNLSDGQSIAFQISKTAVMTGVALYARGDFATDFDLTVTFSINRSSDEKDPFLPYSETVIDIPEAVKALPGYGWSAGTAKNWIDFEKREYHREVAAVDMGTLTWQESWDASPYKRFIAADLGGIAQGATDTFTAGAILCANYETVSADNSYAHIAPKCISVDTIGRLHVYDSTYIADDGTTDLTAFKTAIAGQTLHYALATPEVIDISDILPADNFIEVSPGDEITFESDLGEDFRVPVPSEITYQKKVSTDE